MFDVEGERLAEKFQELLDQERQAEQAYAELAASMTDEATRSQVEDIHREKTRHVELVERLLEIVD